MTDDKPLGLNKRVAKALQEATKPMTMSEVMAAADIAKTSAAEVSSALHKLRNRALVKTVRGETTAPSGPKFVRRYVWVGKPATTVVKVQVVQTVAVSPLQMLGMGRVR